MGIPLLAILGKSPDIMTDAQRQKEQYGAQNASQQVQLDQQLVQARQRTLDQQTAINEAYKNSVQLDANGQPQFDTAALTKALSASGHGSAVPDILENITKFQKTKNDVMEQAQKLQVGATDMLGHAAAAIQAAKYDPTISHKILDTLPRNPQIDQLRSIIDTQPDAFRQQVDAAEAASPARQKIQAGLEEARIRAAGRTPEGELPLPNIDQMNQGLTSRYQVLNPNQPLPPQFTLPANATQKDFDRIDKVMGQTEQAQATRAQQDTANEIRRQTLLLSQQTRGDARTDKSYQFSVGELDKVGKPITDAVARFGRLQDTIPKKPPQADALVAPELLTVMAGGAGSGLRMNEAEISRVVGGRSNLESLKAALNKWSLNPSQALSNTAAQRSEEHTSEL